MSAVQVLIDGDVKFDSESVSGCTVERQYDGEHTAIVRIHYESEKS